MAESNFGECATESNFVTIKNPIEETEQIFLRLEGNLMTGVDNVIARNTRKTSPGKTTDIIDDLSRCFKTALAETTLQIRQVRAEDQGKSNDALHMIEKYLSGMLETWRLRSELTVIDMDVLRNSVRNAVCCFSNWFDAKAKLHEGSEEGQRVEESSVPPLSDTSFGDVPASRPIVQLRKSLMRLDKQRENMTTQQTGSSRDASEVDTNYERTDIDKVTPCPLKCKLSDSLRNCKNILNEAEAKVEVLFMLAQLRQRLLPPVERSKEEIKMASQLLGSTEEIMESMQYSLQNIKLRLL